MIGRMMAGWIGIAWCLAVVGSGCSKKDDAANGEIRDDSDLSSLVVRDSISAPVGMDAPKVYATGTFVVDSISILDSLLGLGSGDSSSPRFPATLGDSLQALVAAMERPIRSGVYDTNQCTGAELSVRTFADGLEATFSDSLPDRIYFRGNSLGHLGLKAGDSPDQVSERFGKPAASGQGYRIHVSDQPFPGQADYCDSRWRILSLFHGDRLNRVLLTFCFEDC